MITVTVEPSVEMKNLLVAAYLDGQLVSEFREAIHEGRPIFEEDLYGDREFHEVADELESLIEMMLAEEVEFTIKECGHEISLEVLENILGDGRNRFESPYT